MGFSLRCKVKSTTNQARILFLYIGKFHPTLLESTVRILNGHFLAGTEWGFRCIENGKILSDSRVDKLYIADRGFWISFK